MKVKLNSFLSVCVTVAICIAIGIGCSANSRLISNYQSGLKSNDKKSCEDAIAGIAKLKRKDAIKFIPDLITIIMRGTDPDIRSFALETLGGMSPEITSEINDAVIISMNDPNMILRRTAVTIVNDFPNMPPTIINVMQRHLTDEDQIVRELVMATFEKIGKLGLHTLMRALEDPNDQMRLAAIMTLRRLGNTASGAADVLQNLQNNDSSDDVRKAAGESLAYIRNN